MAYEPGRKTLTVAASADAFGKAFSFGRLTIHERMPPFLVRRAPRENTSWLFMHFHSPAIIGAQQERHIELPANSVAIWPPASAHLLGHPHLSWDHSWCFASGPAIDDLMRDAGIEAPCHFQLDSGALSTRFFSDCHDELLQPAPDPAIVLAHLTIWIHCCRRSAGRKGAEQLRERRLVRVREYIEAHLAEDLPLERLATIAECSPSHFSAIFRDCFGSSPGAFLVERRLAQAAMLLRRDPGPIAAIAQACGFKDPFHFSRIFKRRYGASPRAYRRGEERQLPGAQP